VKQLTLHKNDDREEHYSPCQVVEEVITNNETIVSKTPHKQPDDGEEITHKGNRSNGIINWIVFSVVALYLAWKFLP